MDRASPQGPGVASGRRTGARNGRPGAGEPAGLADLYDRHGAACFALARFLTGDRALAEDIVADAFGAVWHNRDDPGRQRLSVRLRLLTCTRQRAVEMRRRGELPHRSITGCEQLLLQPAGSMHPYIQAGALPARAELALLSGCERQTLALACLGGYTEAEIAVITGVPPATVRARALLAMRRLGRQNHPAALSH